MSVTPGGRQLREPGAGLDAARMPGHWLLARLGKRVLRPGGVELTRWMLDRLEIGPGDHVVELAAGLGTTGLLVLARRPAGYLGVDRDPAAVAAVDALPRVGAVEVRGHRADAARTGLPAGCATVAYGEAMLTMQPEARKRRIVRETHRLLAPSGRYGIPELCLVPDDIDAGVADEITAALGDAIRVGTRPLTASGWRELLTSAGFTVVAEDTVPMRLLETRRLVADEGILATTRIAVRALQDPAARRRVRRMSQVFHRYRHHLAAAGLVAVRP